MGMKAEAVVPMLTLPIKNDGFAFLERLNECWKWLSYLREIVNRQLDGHSDNAPDKGQHALSEDLPALHPDAALRGPGTEFTLIRLVSHVIITGIKLCTSARSASATAPSTSGSASTTSTRPTTRSKASRCASTRSRTWKR